MTAKLDLDPQPKNPGAKWTMTSLFAIRSAIKEAVKTLSFIEAMTFYTLFVSGIAELIGHHMSLGWNFVVVLTLLMTFVVRMSKLAQQDEKLDSPTE